MRELIKRWCPPALLELLRSGRGAGEPAPTQGSFKGPYRDWQEASANATGYDASVIFEKTRVATLKVRDGEAAFERDSVVMERADYPLFLISSLLHVAVARGGRLRVLDLGGALGSSYFQCARFISPIVSLRWSVVEQRHYVEYGRRELETENLRFYDTVEACVQAEVPDVVVLSGVLQYLERPHEMIDEIGARDIDYVVVDRQPLSSDAVDQLCVVTIPPTIYDASYPFWMLSEARFRAAWARRYDLLAEMEREPLASHLGVLKRRQIFYRRRGAR
jgi:putative methyltransferase (TIGR04325 family)